MGPSRAAVRSARRVFSTADYRQVLQQGNCARLEDAIAELRVDLRLGVSATREDVVAGAWRWLLKHRRDDAALRSLFLSRSERNPLTIQGNDFAFEMKAGGAVVDFACLAPGHEEGVEIKSQYDSASRVAFQIAQYRRVLPRVSIVGDATDWRRLRRLADEFGLGLLVLESHSAARHLVRVLEAPLHENNLDVSALVGLLRIGELSQVVADVTGRELVAGRTKLFGEAVALCRSSGLPTTYVMRAVLDQIARRRQLSARTVERRVPAPLRSIVATIDPREADLPVLRGWLDAEV